MPRRKKIQNKKSKSRINKSVKKTTTSNKAEDELFAKERIEKDKRLIMWSGVTFFMALILTLWVFNMKTVFKSVEGENEPAGFEWRETTNELSKTINEFKTNWNEIKVESNLNNTVDSENASSSELTKDEIEELKIKIEELEIKLNNEEK